MTSNSNGRSRSRGKFAGSSGALGKATQFSMHDEPFDEVQHVQDPHDDQDIGLSVITSDLVESPLNSVPISYIQSSVPPKVCSAHDSTSVGLVFSLYEAPKVSPGFDMSDIVSLKEKLELAELNIQRLNQALQMKDGHGHTVSE